MKRHGSLNRIYRLVWSGVANCWVPVAETARRRGKGACRKDRRKLVATALSLSAAGFISPFAVAGPSGGQVVSGTGTITQSGSTTTVQQSSQNLSLNWATFNIAPQQTVDFVQPSASAIAVNRIFDTNGSQILGHLDANGQVYLINPNGVLFGASAQVNVGGLVASTLDVSEASLGSNTRSFSGNGTGSVVNQGSINAANGGYVALLGNHVSNQGTVTAQLGAVALGAGSAVTLTFSGDSLVHVQVDRSVLNSLAENGGLIRADGGTVVMTAGAAKSLLASVVNNTGVIEARTVQNLGSDQSGTITLLGGMTAGTVDVDGTLDASAPNGGNGGFIETSAANVKVANDLKVTTAALSGLTGSWLVDPKDFTVEASGGDETGATLSAALDNNNVTISSASGANGTAGNVNIDDTVTWVTHKLTIDASNDININAVMSANSGASLDLEPTSGNVNMGFGPSGFSGQVNFYTNGGTSSPGTTVRTGTGFLTIGTHGYNVVNSIGSVGTSGFFALGANITTAVTSPVTSFASGSVFDGLGHTVNLNITTPVVTVFGENAGLFATSNGTIRNVGVTGGLNLGNNYGGGVGALVGVNYGTVRNSFSTAAVTANVGSFRVGGLVGLNYGSISRSYANATVSGDGTTGSVGGLVGANYGGTISNSYAAGNVSGGNSVGGLVGFNENEGTSAGTISNTYATGSVTGSSYVGGLVGSNYGNGGTANVSTSFAAGHVIGSSAGGLIGQNLNSGGTTTFTNNFWDKTTTGQSSSAGGSGTGVATTSAMQTQGTFTAWDFSGTWTIYGGHTYPLLQVFMTPVTVQANSATVTYNGTNQSSVTYLSYGATISAPTLSGTLTYAATGSGSNPAHAGTYTITPGGQYSNQLGYLITDASGSLTVDAETLTPTLTNSSVTKTYNGNTNAPSGFTPTYSFTGLVSGDTAATLTDTSVAYNSAHVASATGVTVSGLSISSITGSNGSLATDYTLASSSVNVAATITAAPVTVGLSNTTGVTKNYDGTTAAPSGFSPTYSITGLVAGDSATLSSSATPVFNSAHVATATAIVQGGLSLVAITGNGTDNSVLSDYTLSSTTAATGNGIASITPATLAPTLTNSGVTKAYDGTTNAPAGFTPTYSLSGLVSGDTAASLTDTGVAYNSAHVASANQVTVSGLSIGGITGSNGSLTSDYTLASSSTSVAATITAASLTPTLTNSGVTKAYDGTTNAPAGFTPTYSLSGLVSGDTAASLTDTGVAYNSAHVASANQVTVSGLSIGGITGSNASQASDYTLSSSSAGVAASITPLTLTATAPSIGGTLTKVYDGSTAALGASLSGGSVSGALSGDSVSLNTSAIALAYNSSHVVSASSIGASGTLGVDINSSTSGSQSTDYSVTLPTISPVAATITAASLTPTLTNSGVTKAYDGTTNAPVGFTPTYSLSGLVSGDTAASLTDTGVAYNSAHVASANQVTVSGLSIGGITGSNGSLTSDYTLASSSTSVAATITPLTLAINLSNVANVSKTYDGTTAAPSGFGPTYSITGLVAGDSATLSSSATPVFNSAHVATATAITQGGLSLTSISGNGSDNSVLSDYNLSNTTASTGAGVASITPLTLAATAPSIGGTLTKTYDGTTAASGASLIGGSVSGALSGDGVSLNTSGIALAYNSSHVVSASSISASGTLGVDINSSTSGSQSTDYSVTLPTISPVAATITATSLTPTLTNSGVTKAYDGTTNAPAGFTPTYSLSGLVSGDTAASLTDTGVAYNSAHVASANQVTVSGLSIGGITGSNASQAGDYTLSSSSAGVAASITPLTLTATAPSIGGTLTKVYDGSTAAPGASLSGGSVSGALSGDSVSLNTSAIALAYNSSHVVSASSIGASGTLGVDINSSTSGSQSTDYSVTLPTISPVAATITAASLTPTLTNSGVTKAYDGTTNAPAGFTPTYSLSGLVSGDTAASLTDTGVAYNSAHVASANQVTVSGLSIGGITGSNGSLASDYTLASSSAGVAASITPASLTINLSNVADVSKTYDGTTAAPSGFTPTYSIAGLVSGDSATVSGSTAVYNSAHVASATTITLSGLSLSSITGNGSDNSVPSDYTLANTTVSTGNGVASITPALVTATAPIIGGITTKVYDGTTAATGATLSGGAVSGAVSGDTLTLNTSGISLNYNTAQTTATTISASGSTSLDISSSTSGSLLSDYSFTQPVIASVPGTITAASASAPTSTPVPADLPSPLLLVIQPDTRSDTQMEPNLHVIEGGVRLPDDLVIGQ